jgi:tRNA(Ile)-lysidine synthase
VGAQAFLPGGVTLTVGYESLLLARPDAAPPSDLPQLPGDEPLALPVPGSVVLDNGWEILAERLETRPDDLAATDRWTAHFDAAPITGQQLWVRPRLPGERFQPLGMNGRHAAVKEAMIGSHLAAKLRARWPLVATDMHLLWIAGHQLDRRACVTPETSAILRLRCRRASPPAGDRAMPTDH